MGKSDNNGSSIDLLKSMKNGLTSTVTGELTSIAISGVEWAIGKGLNAAFGWESPDQQRQNWAKETLENITLELQIIQEDIDHLQTQMGQLLQISEEDDFLNQYNQSVIAFEGYQTDLHVVWKAFSRLIQDLNNPRITVKDPKGKVEKMVDEYHITLEKAITGMEDRLFNPLLSTGKNIIQSWTDATIIKLKNGEGDLYSWYMTIESKLRHFLQSLITGYVLQVNFLNYMVELPKEGKTSEKMETPGLNYYGGSIGPVMEKIMENFSLCVERLIISTYHPQSISPAKNDTIIPFASDAEIDKVCERSNLFRWLVMSFNTVEKNPGLFYTCFTRPSQLINGSGPVCKPNDKLEASSGVLIPIESTYNSFGEHMDNWYKCADIIDIDKDKSVLQLRSFADSNIRTLRYHWPLLDNELEAGEIIAKDDINNIFYNRSIKYYDKLTLNAINTKEVDFDTESGEAINAVLMASVGSGNDLRENIFMNYNKSYSAYGWNLDYKNGLRTKDIPNSLIKDYNPGSRFSNKLPYYGEIELILPYKLHTEDHRRSAFVGLKIAMPKEDLVRDMHFIMDSNYSVGYQELNHLELAAKVHIDFEFDIDYPEDTYHGSIPRPEKYKDAKIGGEIRSEVNYEVYRNTKQQLVQCIPNSQLRIRWNYIFHIEEKYDQKGYPGPEDVTTKVDRKISAKWNVENFRLAWPYPTLRIS